jgi:hypothetical protein
MSVDDHILKGKILGCWCYKEKNEKCHGDVLLKILEKKLSSYMIFQ